jgi:hypothetical protein
VFKRGRATTTVNSKVIDRAYSKPYPDRATANRAADHLSAGFAKDLQSDPRVSDMRHIFIPDPVEDPPGEPQN